MKQSQTFFESLDYISNKCIEDFLISNRPVWNSVLEDSNVFYQNKPKEKKIMWPIKKTDMQH